MSGLGIFIEGLVFFLSAEFNGSVAALVFDVLEFELLVSREVGCFG